MENDSTPQSHAGGSGEENGLEDETSTNEVKEIPDATSPVEKALEAEGQTQGDVVDKEKHENKGRNEEEGESIIPASTSDLHPSFSARENSSCCHLPREDANTEDTSSSANPDLLHPNQRRHPPTRGSHLTKRDKKIIEKIRSYYEAAAEAKEDETGEEDEQGDGVASRRRNSFSQIPSGLVKESVSRFDVGGHQGELESGPSKYEATEAMDRETTGETGSHSPADPASSQTPLSADTENDGQTDKPISSLDFDVEGPIKSPISNVMLGKETPNQVGLNLQSNPNSPVGEEAGLQDKNGKVCKGPLEEGLEAKQEAETSVVATGPQGGNSLLEEGPSIARQYKCRDETAKTSPGNQAALNGHEPNQTGPAEPNGSHRETSKPLPPTEQCQKTETKTQSSWTRTKNRDLPKTSVNLEVLPSQINVGRWSHHSRIVSVNRALFEGMGSDVAGIGLFEASPVVDPMLMENSERILSKVQTLAQMYSAKASTMKVPLHQKRASTVRNPSWSSGRLSGFLTQKQTLTEYQQQNQMEKSQSDAHTEKYRSQTHSEAKFQSETITETRQQSQIQTKKQKWSQAKTHYQIQNQAKTYNQYQTQTMTWQDQTIQEERTIKRAESLTNGRWPF